MAEQPVHDTSSLDEDSDYQGDETRGDTELVESQGVRLHRPHDTHGGGGAASSGVYCHGREVVAPYLQRDDIGTFGVYVGNWSGRRKLTVINNHIAADLIVRNAAQVIVAQEVDDRFIAALLEPQLSREAMSAPHPVPEQPSPTVVGASGACDYADRPANLSPWCVASGAEGHGSESTTLIIAARSTVAKSSKVVEWNKMFHCMYTNKQRQSMAYSRLLIAQVEWIKPMHGRASHIFLNAHLHNLVAKQELLG